MKRIARTLCMMGVLALAFTSCQKNEDTAKMFYASVNEMEEEDGDRAYIDGSVTKFETGDVAMMFNIDNTTPANSTSALYTAASTGNIVEFNHSSGTITNERKDSFFAFYPGNNVTTSSLTTDNSSIFTINPTQNYRANMVASEALAMASKDASNSSIDNAHFRFQNIMGVVRVRLTDDSDSPKAVRSIVYEDANFNVSGDVHLKVNEVDPNEMTALFNAYTDIENPPANLAAYIQRVGYYVDGDNKGKTMTLDCGANGVQLSGTRTDFNIVLRPLANLGGDGTITVNFTDNTKIVIDNYTKKVKPNVITNVSRNVKDFEIVEQ